ncbi:MAG: putative transporter permease [Clostridia bacterium]|jgi:fluoroquinolone transport system permease protein|nr:putative transporter permease [Clostridia bacterium]
MRILQAVKYDIKFQFRHGFYYAYLLLTILYIFAFRLMPIDAARYAATVIVFSDPAVMGFFFIGGIVLLEKGQNIYQSLFVTPLRVHEYLIAKAVSLTLLSTITSFAIIVLSFGRVENPLIFLLGVVFTSVLFTLIGFTLAVRCKNINQYIIISPLYTIIFMLPMLEYFGLTKSWLFNLLPAKPSLILIKAAFYNITFADTAFGIIALLIWCVISYVWAKDWFYKYIVLRAGDGN